MADVGYSEVTATVQADQRVITGATVAFDSANTTTPAENLTLNTDKTNLLMPQADKNQLLKPQSDQFTVRTPVKRQAIK